MDLLDVEKLEGADDGKISDRGQHLWPQKEMSSPYEI